MSVIGQSYYINHNLSIAATAAQAFKALEKMGVEGNYWATETIRSIRKLAAGKYSHGSVFISTDEHIESRDLTIMLPGCKVIAYHQQDGKYLVTRIEADLEYNDKQNNFKKPAILWAKKTRNEWRAKVKLDGTLQHQSQDSENWILAGVTDRLPKAQYAVNVTAEHIKYSPFHINGDVDKLGFNLLFSPGEKQFSGIKLLKLTSSKSAPELLESAMILAQTMEKAYLTYKQTKMLKNTPKHQVAWVTQRGGSAIMEKALRILKNKNIQLEHSQKVFLSHPTTNPNEIYNLGLQVGMLFDNNVSISSHSPMNINEFLPAISNVRTTMNRARKERNNGYGMFEEGRDHLAAYGGMSSVAGTATASIAAYAGTAGLSAMAGLLIAAAMNSPQIRDFPNLKSAIEYQKHKLVS